MCVASVMTVRRHDTPSAFFDCRPGTREAEDRGQLRWCSLPNAEEESRSSSATMMQHQRKGCRRRWVSSAAGVVGRIFRHWFAFFGATCTVCNTSGCSIFFGILAEASHKEEKAALTTDARDPRRNTLQPHSFRITF